LKTNGTLIRVPFLFWLYKILLKASNLKLVFITCIPQFVIHPKIFIMTLKKLLTFIFLFATFLINAQQKIKHKVVQGESVYSIAKKYNVTEKEIFDLNPKAKGVLALDMELIIPKVSKKKEETKKVVVPKGNSYTVQNGESFYTISRKFNVGYETLTELNAEIKPENLQIGAIIRLPKGVKLPKEEKIKEVSKNKLSGKAQKHTVESGESFFVIAKKYNVTVEELRVANPQVKNDKLDIKDVVFIPGKDIATIKEKKLKEEKKKPIIEEKIDLELTDKEKEEVKAEIDSLTERHKVQSRETKFGIAKRYGLTVAELDELNPNVKELKPGQVLVLKKNLVTIEDKPKTIEEYEEENTPTFVPPMDATAETKAQFLISKASECLGVRYRSGGNDRRGFDCSGFVSYTFRYLEMDLPRSSWEMANIGIKIDRSQAQKGDLIFFKTVRSGISHVGLITEVSDNDIKFIHSSTNSGVIVSSVNETYYARRFVQINRVLQ